MQAQLDVDIQEKEAKTVEQVLKEFGEPIRLKDLVSLTDGKITWQNNPTNQILRYMKIANIERAGFGMYQYKNNKVEETKSIDEKILEPQESDKKLLESFRSQSKPVFSKQKQKPKYKSGDIIKGRITGIEEYGAFITSEDEMVQGLIHITNVRKGVTDDIYRHFKIGDIVEARVLSVKNDGKLSLSTIDFDLPDYFANEKIQESIKPIKDKLGHSNISRPVAELDNKELKQVLDFIQSITGVVSEEATNKIKEIIEKEGMFKFTMALMKSSKNFKVDVSLLFANEVERNLRDVL